jgi:L-lactate dehydrogenase (cytochrome)
MMRLERVIDVEHLRGLANRRLPKVVFDYLDGGAEDEVTLRANCEAFNSITFRPRNAVAFAQCNLRSSVLGFDLSFPAVLAPIGYSRMVHHAGEIASAGAAGAAGTAYILSTISGHRLEDVKAASNNHIRQRAQSSI